MFCLEKFYKEAHNGKEINKKELFEYIKMFKNVILWGAGNLGKEVGASLKGNQVEITAYWDMNYQTNTLCNEIDVIEPFSGNFSTEETLVIPCIVNGSLGNHWTERELEKKGYFFHLSGMAYYEGVVCPLNEEYFNIRECTGRKACSLCNCERYTKLLNQKINKQDMLTFQLMTFIISTRCSLNCKYCGQRLSEYRGEDKKDFPLENIKRDISNFLEAADFVGMISIIGGEPFVHPNLVEIVEHCLTKDNFGVVNITTNGIVKLTQEALERLKDDRVKISFSIYDTYLTQKQKQLLEKNIELVKESGINYSLSHPLWVKPGEIKDYKYDDTFMRKRKQHCDSIKMCASVRDGIFYPCTMAENIESLHICSAGNAKVDVTEKEELRERLLKCLEEEYFDACRFCSSEALEEIIAGEQV